MLVRYMNFAKGDYLPPSRELKGITLALRPLKERYGHTLAADFGPLALRAMLELLWWTGGAAERDLFNANGRT